MSSSFDIEANIHPDLHRSSVDTYLEESLCRFQAQFSQTLQARQNLDPDAANQTPDFSDSPNDPMVATSTAISAPNMAATARRLKRKMEFSDEAEADFDEFCVVHGSLLLIATLIYCA